MKEKIQELILQQKTAKTEVKYLLEELSQIEESKLDYKELDALKESKIRYEVEYEMRQIMIQDLQSLL